MPAGRFHRYRRYKKKRYTGKKYKKRYNPNKYRRNVARMVRPLNVKPRSAMQNVVYYNSFRCVPSLDTSQAAGSKQQNYNIRIAMNSLWPFQTGWNNFATNTAGTNNQICAPNAGITEYTFPSVSPLTGTETVMPNVRDGSSLFDQYSKCFVVGTKVTIVATPLGNSTDIQLGYLYAIKHSQPGTGMNLLSKINDVQKLPYRKMAKLVGPDAPTSGFQSGEKVGAKLIIKHSVKRFNNVKDIRDNSVLSNKTGSNASGATASEQDFLTIGVIPALNNLDTKCTDFCLQIRIEQRLLWTEPLESLVGDSAGQGNYSFPWAAHTMV